MSKKVDIDTILADDELELTLGGKVYCVKDVPLSVFLRASKGIEGDDLEELHKQLAAILGVKKDALKDVGFKAAGLAINEVNKWILDIAKDEGEVKNPSTNP